MLSYNSGPFSPQKLEDQTAATRVYEPRSSGVNLLTDHAVVKAATPRVPGSPVGAIMAALPKTPKGPKLPPTRVEMP
jgi:hypothetical protein